MRKKKVIKHKVKQPSLLRQLLAIHMEQAKRHKALRLLSQQVWSVEFLEYLVEHASKMNGREISLLIEDAEGRKLTIRSTGRANPLEYDDNIFNHLDDQNAVNAFIAQNSRR